MRECCFIHWQAEFCTIIYFPFFTCARGADTRWRVRRLEFPLPAPHQGESEGHGDPGQCGRSLHSLAQRDCFGNYFGLPVMKDGICVTVLAADFIAPRAPHSRHFFIIPVKSLYNYRDMAGRQVDLMPAAAQQ